MAIYTPLQVPQPPITDSHVVQSAPTPRRVHTRAAHRLGLVLDVTLALIAVGVILALIF
jgi:hypothetical protein